MKNPLNVLVLGVGGNVSQGILKSLAISNLDCRVIGACTSHLAFGLYTVDTAYISPLANNPRFIDWLLDVCHKECVDVILSGVEPVLDILAQNSELIRANTGAIAVVSSPYQLGMSIDKLETCRWLEKNGFNYPQYAAAEDNNALKNLVLSCGFPLIAKPRRGKGAHGVILVESERDLEYLSAKNDYVVQEYLGSTELEYTVGCFCDSSGRLKGSITMRRDLLEGTTVRAEVGDFPDIRHEASRIAACLKPTGPCNIQMRVSNGKPVCFEINLRFSGTTPIRAHLGFNEVEAALKHFVLSKELDDFPLITEGTILRYWNEMYVDSQAAELLKRNGYLQSPGSYQIKIDDYGLR
ncbi:MAG: ATP-grasp domain-containing protein [Syntrophomonadaceae bacterium]|nr:ATP-grasp domain-containing protein [Syntrophomonadaceae bacterium]